MCSGKRAQELSDSHNQFDQQLLTTGKQARVGYLLLAYASLVMGIAGILLPLLPATPFLLMAVWAASRGSQRVHDWIFDQPRLARLINEWRDQGAIPCSAKWLASMMMIASFATLIWSGMSVLVLFGMGVFFSAIGGFLWTRPNPLR